MYFANPVRTKKLILMASISVFVAGLISSAHHWYGAVAYDSPWRAGVSYWIMACVLVVFFFLYMYWKYVNHLLGRIALWLFFVVAVIIQTGFTLFECVYSHVLKDILYFSGMPKFILEQMYPAPAYHLPDNWLFEFTGLLQLAGFVAAWFAYRVFQDRPWAL